MAAKLSDCLTKAKGIGILTDAEMAFVMRRAAELGNEQQAVKEIHAQRMKEYEAIKAPDAADRVVTQTLDETVALAAYAEEVRNATKSGIQPGAQALEAGRQAGEAAITGQPAPAQTADADIESVRSFLVSPQQQGHTVRPSTEEQQQTARQLGTKLIQLHGIGNVKMQDTFGMYQGAHNRQFVTSFDAKHNANLTALVQNMATEAGRAGQDSIRISRQLEPGEDSDNARPGISVEFKHPIPVERIDDIVRFLRARGIDGFDLVPDGYDVATGNPRTFKALRFEEIPEFSQQPRSRKDQVLLELKEELMKMEEVANVSHELYDTVVLTSQDYDKNGILKGAAGGVRAAAWADRAFHASDPQAARKRDEARAVGAQAEVPAPQFGSAEEVASKELETAAALIAAGSKAAPTALIAYQGIYRRVVALMQQNRAILEGKKWSSATPEQVKSEALLRALGELDAMLKFVPDEVRGKVGGFFQLAKVGVGEQALAKFFGDRVRTLERVLEQYLKKQYLAEISDLFNKNKAKTTNGIQKSARMDADSQMAVEAARTFSKLDAAGLAKTLLGFEADIARLDVSDADAATIDEQRLIAEQGLAIATLFGDLTHRHARELYSAYTWLKEVVTIGKLAWKAEAQRIAAQNQSRAQELIDKLGLATLPGLTRTEQGREVDTQVVENFLKGHYSFVQLLDHLIPGLSFTADWQKMARQSDNGKMDFHIAASDRLHGMIQTAIGSKNWISFEHASAKLKKLHKGVIQMDGQPLDMTQLDAIQYILSWEQEDVRAKMVARGFDEDKMTAIRALASDNVSMAVYQFLRKEYAEFYDKVNPLYRKIYGIDLPRIQFYAPSRFHHGGAEHEITSFGGPVSTSGSTAGFMHGRTIHNAPIRQSDALTVYWQHVNDVSHFLNDAQMLREIRGVLTKPEVRLAIIQKFGPKIWEQARRWMDLMGRAANTKNNELSSVSHMFDRIATAQAMLSLLWNARSLGMQADSASRVTIERPIKQIARALFTLGKTHVVPAAPWYKAFKSDTIQRRIKLGASPAVKYVLEKAEVSPDMVLRFARLGILPLQYVDAYATSVSAMISFEAAWNEAKDLGMLDAAAADYAADKMDDAVYRYSQPVGLYNRSLHAATGGPVTKMLMLFKSDPTLKTAIQLQAAGELRKGIDIRKNLRRLLAIEVMFAVSHTISNMYRSIFTDDDEEDIWTVGGYVNAVASQPFAGLLWFGGGIESLMSWAIENRYLEGYRDPLNEGVERFTKAVKNWEDLFDPDDPEDFRKEVENIARSFALISAAGSVVLPIPGMKAGTTGATLIAAIANFMKPITGAMRNAENSD